MFVLVAISALLASSAAVVRADPNPNAPGPGAVFNAGSQCTLGWDVDPTGTWKKMNIQLMTGDNYNMVALTTVATVDGTDSAANTFSWTCPEVNPYAAEYFYQFTSPASQNTLWTTRFTIASPSGATVPATNPTQPGGAAIPWGVGSLIGGVTTSAPPTGVPTSASVTGTAASASSSSTSSSASTSSAASAPAPTPAPPSSAPLTLGASSSGFHTTASSSKLPSTSGSVSSNSTNAAMGALSVDTRLLQTAVALSFAAVGFAALL